MEDFDSGHNSYVSLWSLATDLGPGEGSGRRPVHLRELRFYGLKGSNILAPQHCQRGDTDQDVGDSTL